jgi:hypothetical protein
MKAAKQATGGQPATGISSTWAGASDSPKSIIDTEATGKRQRPHGIIPLSCACPLAVLSHPLLHSLHQQPKDLLERPIDLKGGRLKEASAVFLW